MVLFLLLMVSGTFFLGANDVYVKKVLRSGIPEGFILALATGGSGLILLLIAAIQGIPEIGDGFVGAFMGTVVLNIVAQLLWYKAFKREDASLISPIRLLTTPFVLFTGFLLLKEVPSALGASGIFVTIVGLWLLLSGESKEEKSVLEVLKRPGVTFAVLGALLYAFSSPLDKAAVLNSSPLFFSGAAFTLIGLGSFIIALMEGHKARSFQLLVEYGNKKELAGLVLTHTLAAGLTASALPYALIAYSASLKRLSSLWAVVLSGAFLKEKNILRKVLATIIMLGGIATTLLWG